MTRILVTGGSGLLGRHVAAEAMKQHDVGVLDIKAPVQDVPFHNCSVTDLDGVRQAVRGYDRVIHLAGIDDGVEAPDHIYFETNVQGSWNVLHAAELEGIRHVVLASSGAALGLDGETPPDYLPIDEDHPLRPGEVYSLSKQLIEKMAASFSRRGLTTICLRPTLILRPEAAYEVVTLLNELGPDQGGGGIETGVPAYPAEHLPSMRTYVTSADTARAFVVAAESNLTGFHRFVVSAADTVGGVATLPHLEKLYGNLPEVRDADRFQQQPSASPLSTDRITEVLGWKPVDDWPSILEHVRNNPITKAN